MRSRFGMGIQHVAFVWARRPLAACRAVLFSSLVDDPESDPQYLKADETVDEEAAGIKRADLFNLIEELVMWENSNNADVIRTARAEIARCVASRLIETGALKKSEKLEVRREERGKRSEQRGIPHSSFLTPHSSLLSPTRPGIWSLAAIAGPCPRDSTPRSGEFAFRLTCRDCRRLRS